ncbi:MAG TPA: MFS transporter [Thermoleophilaceae bacterium]|nr:MFS transporter [Thermoleophilaceae bacterium]
MHHSAATTSRHSDERRPWALLVLLCVAQFMVILDVTVVNVALPSIGHDLGFAPRDLQWVVTTYVLFTGGLLLLGGRVADLLGRRHVFIAGLVLFTAASLASGLAPTPAALIVARGAQGLGAAMLSPAALSIITTTYSGAQRTTALSVWGAIGAGGAAAGVLLGGILTTSLGWESVFFINVPIGIAATLLAARLVPIAGSPGGSLRELDLAGAGTLVSGLVVLVYGVEGASRHGWGSLQTIVLIAAAAVVLATHVRIERRSTRPLIPPATWEVRSLVSSAAVMLGATGILVGTFFLNSLFLQNVLGSSALETGLAFLPLVLVIGLAAHAGPHLLEQFGARVVVIAGLALVAGGELVLSRAGAGAGYFANLLPGFVPLGLGIGLVFVSVSVTGMSEIDGERAGLASGLMTTAHEIGGAFGVSIFSAVALSGGTSLAQGYAHGAVAGAIVAGALAVVAALAVPAVRPAPGEHVAVH